MWEKEKKQKGVRNIKRRKGKNEKQRKERGKAEKEQGANTVYEPRHTGMGCYETPSQNRNRDNKHGKGTTVGIKLSTPCVQMAGLSNACVAKFRRVSTEWLR